VFVEDLKKIIHKRMEFNLNKLQKAMMEIFIYASTHIFIYRRRVVNDGTKAFIELIHIEFFFMI